MKKLLFLVSLIFTIVSNAQVLLNENCSFLNVGNVGTSLTGATPGQGNWFTFISSTATPAGSNSDFQVVDKGGAYGNAFQLIGPSATTGSRLLFKDLVTLWSGRTTGNDILEVEYDVYTGPATTSRNQFSVYIYSDETTPKVIFGFSLAKNATVGTATYTNLVRGLAHYTNTATPPVTGLFNFGLGTVTPFQIATTNDNWLKVGLSFNKTTGEVKWKVPGLQVNGFVIGAAAGLNPGEIDIIAATGTTTAVPNAVSATGAFDNLIVRASSIDTLLLSNYNFVSNSTFSVSPNPANDYVTISSKNNPISYIELTDINGRVVKTVKIDNFNETTLNISDVSSGVYIMKITSENGISTKKVIKE
jgi:hypothetical protein